MFFVALRVVYHLKTNDSKIQELLRKMYIVQRERERESQSNSQNCNTYYTYEYRVRSMYAVRCTYIDFNLCDRNLLFALSACCMLSCSSSLTYRNIHIIFNINSMECAVSARVQISGRAASINLLQSQILAVSLSLPRARTHKHWDITS